VTVALEIFLKLKGNDSGEVVHFSPPFTLHELSLSIKYLFKLSGNVELSLWNDKFKDYCLVKLVTEIQNESKLLVSPSGDNLWSQIPNKPWAKVLPGDTSSQVVVRQERGGAILDQELWGKLVDLLEKMSPGFDVTGISKAYTKRGTFSKCGRSEPEIQVH